MAYDLYGLKPTADEGKHFSMAYLSWPLLVDLCQQFAPEECSPCVDWRGQHSGDSGLNAEQSRRLALKLQEEMGRGVILEVVADIAEEMEGGESWLSQGDLRDFVVFLEACGGFQIM